ncbi:hypothetical protein FB558_5725 [Pseudonocardia kunmingensis]|uniref:ARB-07466-like C-terminal domain-containing protein n=1 Tax=Pseudonocardia kunmingensis TaxID=630975 RepID=A0A543DKT2_9PSEU|nr:hypothetical protein FB558_5725 [Pseudonocardia kunmingensis]
MLSGAAAATAVATVGALIVESPVESTPTTPDNWLTVGGAADEQSLPGIEALRASVEPVVADPDVVDAAALIKAAGLAEVRAEQEAAARETARCRSDVAEFGPVKPWVARAGGLLRCEFDIATVGGVAQRASASDHPRGLAVDFKTDRATGDALAQCAVDNMRAYSIKYVIWRQRINHGNGWEPMEDRGSATANHVGHVHVSFHARTGSATLPSC